MCYTVEEVVENEKTPSQPGEVPFCRGTYTQGKAHPVAESEWGVERVLCFLSRAWRGGRRILIFLASFGLSLVFKEGRINFPPAKDFPEVFSIFPSTRFRHPVWEFLRVIILNQLRNPHRDQVGIKHWALLLGLRRLLWLKAKMDFVMPLPSPELGVQRQALGLQSRWCLNSCMEGHGLLRLL